MKRSMMILSVTSLVLSNSGINGGENPWWKELPINKEQPWWATKIKKSAEHVTEANAEADPVVHVPVPELPKLLESTATETPIQEELPVAELPKVIEPPRAVSAPEPEAPVIVEETPVAEALVPPEYPVVEDPVTIQKTTDVQMSSFHYELPVLLDQTVIYSESNSSTTAGKPTATKAKSMPETHKTSTKMESEPTVTQDEVPAKSYSAPLFDLFDVIQEPEQKRMSTMKVAVVSKATESKELKSENEPSIISSAQQTTPTRVSMEPKSPNPIQRLISNIKKIDISETFRRKTSWLRGDQRREMEHPTGYSATEIISMPTAEVQEPTGKFHQTTAFKRKNAPALPVLEPEIHALPVSQTAMAIEPEKPVAVAPMVTQKVPQAETNKSATASMIPHEFSPSLPASAVMNSSPATAVVSSKNEGMPSDSASMVPYKIITLTPEESKLTIAKPVATKAEPVLDTAHPAETTKSTFWGNFRKVFTSPKALALPKTMSMPKISLRENFKPKASKDLVRRKDSIDAKWDFKVEQHQMPQASAPAVAEAVYRRENSSSKGGYLLMTLVERQH